MKAARSNPSHRALVNLEKMGYHRSIITQNGDNLHREAGNSRIYEMHGNLYLLNCLECSKKEIIEQETCFEMLEGMIKNMKRFSLEEMVSHLPLCSYGGSGRPDFVAFGETVQNLPQAMAEAKACDLILILGTSGVVYPAASLPGIAQSGGAHLIEINPKRSALTMQTDLFLEGTTGEILPTILSSFEEIILK
ncbi:MAG: Sir2 family NAD-dependent protein deacetylase [Thermodesulfobacteriota bacterium]|nr:Sir2 family NAD-dependent protein deacetylase [Thermodesulfobacteriota bacterium]